MKNSKGIIMNDKFVIDTFAWVEYFLGSKRGEKVKELIESDNAITPTIVIAELSARYLKQSRNFADKSKFIRFNTNIAILNSEIAEFAGKIKIEQRKKKKGFGMVDSIIYATALTLNAKVITGDQHFNDIKEAIII